MATAQLNQPHFQDEDKAREYLEAQLWAYGVVCPHCGTIAEHYKLEGKSHRKGLYKCVDCREQFTVTVGTVFERSKIKLHIWLQAVYLLCSSKKGMSSHQLHRCLGVTYKTAWFMTHRIREALAGNNGGLLGGGGGTVEADETYWGTTPRSKKAQAIRKAGGKVSGADKQKIVSLVERDGNVRSFHVANIDGKSLRAALLGNIAKDAHLMTDDFSIYRKIGREFASHEAVNHSSGEYARGNAHTNTVEGFFSLLKRGLVGTYHHVAPKHLGRYVSEFDFRYNNRKTSDAERTDNALKGIGGKRLMYRGPQGRSVAA
jgi:transposase-like protein